MLELLVIFGLAAVGSALGLTGADPMPDDAPAGTAGDDEVTGTERDDDLALLARDDFAEALEGDDSVDAGAGDDVVLGRSGADRLEGGAGDDVITIEAGDIASGSDGADLFDLYWAGAGDTAVITDFSPGEDVIVLGYAAVSAPVVDVVQSQDNPDDAVIELDGRAFAVVENAHGGLQKADIGLVAL